MKRTYTIFKTNDAEKQLNVLSNLKAGVLDYKNAMFELGKQLGEIIEEKIADSNSKICLACTVEDADFLSRGILEILEKQHEVSLVCFWNNRYKIADVQAAPIIKRYKEKLTGEFKHVIVVKSIISGSCVVRTNLTNLLNEISPEEIFVTAPVVYVNAEKDLKSAFTPEIASKFNFISFAVDSDKLANGNIFPGIGGNVYERLGFGSQDDKNRYVPEIVKRRRDSVTN